MSNFVESVLQSRMMFKQFIRREKVNQLIIGRVYVIPVHDAHYNEILKL